MTRDHHTPKTSAYAQASLFRASFSFNPSTHEPTSIIDLLATDDTHLLLKPSQPPPNLSDEHFDVVQREIDTVKFTTPCEVESEKELQGRIIERRITPFEILQILYARGRFQSVILEVYLLLVESRLLRFEGLSKRWDMSDDARSQPDVQLTTSLLLDGFPSLKRAVEMLGGFDVPVAWLAVQILRTGWSVDAVVGKIEESSMLGRLEGCVMYLGSLLGFEGKVGFGGDGRCGVVGFLLPIGLEDEMEITQEMLVVEFERRFSGVDEAWCQARDSIYTETSGAGSEAKPIEQPASQEESTSYQTTPQQSFWDELDRKSAYEYTTLPSLSPGPIAPSPAAEYLLQSKGTSLLNTSFTFPSEDTKQIPKLTNSSYLWMDDPIPLEDDNGFRGLKELGGAITSTFEKLEKYAPRWGGLWGR